MSEVYETKKGILIVECDCGIVHKIKHIEETDDLEISSKLDKSKIKTPEKTEIENKEESKKEDGKKEKSRFGFFDK